MLATQIADMYLDYFNNYLTPARFAEDHGLTEPQALAVIQLGRELHDERVQYAKQMGKIK